jgi:ubiquinone/menaquinone biosynthesis C-methylase UbiE
VRRDFPDCGVLAGDLLALPFAPRTFDLVIGIRLLAHVRDWPRLVAELCRVARSTVIVDYPRATGFNRLTPIMFPLKKRLEGNNTRYYRTFRDAELYEALRGCGFAPRQLAAQFLLPMVVHRRANGARSLRAVEQLAKFLKVTQAFGSPAVLRADRGQRS